MFHFRLMGFETQNFMHSRQALYQLCYIHNFVYFFFLLLIFTVSWSTWARQNRTICIFKSLCHVCSHVVKFVILQPLSKWSIRHLQCKAHEKPMSSHSRPMLHRAKEPPGGIQTPPIHQCTSSKCMKISVLVCIVVKINFVEEVLNFSIVCGWTLIFKQNPLLESI